MTDAEDAAHWKQLYELERERLVKLFVAYKTLEAQLDADKAAPPAA